MKNKEILRVERADSTATVSRILANAPSSVTATDVRERLGLANKSSVGMKAAFF